MNYDVISDDIIRFADSLRLERFTVLGHSLGGRSSMTVACRFPDRVDGCISVDAAPINESSDKSFGEFTYSVLAFMNKLSEDAVSIDEATKRANEFFKGKIQFVSLLTRNLDPNHKDEIKWLVNVEALLREFRNIPYFDESLSFHGPTLQIVGGRSKIHPFEAYQKVFPNITRDDVQIVEGAGHWVHFDKPLETIKLVSNFLDKLD
jgi:pimeloyl-ACP methyl ester carboxylesterase